MELARQPPVVGACGLTGTKLPFRHNATPWVKVGEAMPTDCTHKAPLP
jgi:hypothetical protein